MVSTIKIICKTCKKLRFTNSVGVCMVCERKAIELSNMDVHVDVSTNNKVVGVDVHTKDYHKKQRKTIRLSTEDWSRLEEISNKFNTTLSDTIKLLINYYTT